MSTEPHWVDQLKPGDLVITSWGTKRELRQVEDVTSVRVKVGGVLFQKTKARSPNYDPKKWTLEEATPDAIDKLVRERAIASIEYAVRQGHLKDMYTSHLVEAEKWILHYYQFMSEESDFPDEYLLVRHDKITSVVSDTTQ